MSHLAEKVAAKHDSMKLDLKVHRNRTSSITYRHNAEPGAASETSTPHYYYFTVAQHEAQSTFRRLVKRESMRQKDASAMELLAPPASRPKPRGMRILQCGITLRPE